MGAAIPTHVYVIFRSVRICDVLLLVVRAPIIRFTY
jgi:hypothetical protein